MEQKTSPPSRLRGTILLGIVTMIRAEGLTPGDPLVELAIATRLGVSRTPVRAALGLLVKQGIAARGRRGFVLARIPADAAAPALPEAEAADQEDRLSLAITGDWRAGAFPESLSEADLIRRYRVSRPLLQRALAQLAQVAVVERKPGHGWRFLPAITDTAARAESYRFRMVVEPAALLEPGFRLADGWLDAMRARHCAMLDAPWRDASGVAFYEMNAAFHEGLAAASGNRFLLLSVQQQNRLRRVSNYAWTARGETAQVAQRVQISCTEHLQILDAVGHGAMEVAAALMRRHLELTQVTGQLSFIIS